MSLKLCPECGIRKDMLTPDGICTECHWKIQDEEDRRGFINTSFPKGIITRWVDTPSFLSKKGNRMYFMIPPKQNQYFDPDTEYEIVIKEVSA